MLITKADDGRLAERLEASLSWSDSILIQVTRDSLRASLEREAALAAERDALKKDQGDWRKGVELIASSLGERNPPDLCCSRISEVALTLRAHAEELEAERDALLGTIRRITGELGEFADREGNTAIAKIKFICTDRAALLKRVEEAEGKVCRIAVIVNDARLREEDDYVSDIADEIEASTPCPHKEEAERLREAVRWILERHDSGVIHPVHDWVEFRRRAEGRGR